MDRFEIAVRYWDRGFSVIPLKPKSKEPYIAWKEYQTRLPSYDELNRWRSIWEGGGNIGIVCGKVSGNLIVLDLDNQKIFDNFSSEYPELTRTWIVKTSRGYHVWLKCEDTKSRGLIRGEGTYVVAPASTHPDGTKYKFLPNSKSYGLKQVGEIPDLRLIRLPKSIRPLITEGDLLGKYKSRSESDMAAICAMVRFGYSDEQIKEIFQNENWKIGEKFKEKGEYGEKYLNYSITKARSFISAKDAEF